MSGGLVLRALEPRDAREVHAIVGDPDVARTGGGLPFESEDVWTQRLGAAKADAVLWLGAFDGEVLVGFGSLATHHSIRRRHVATLAVNVAAHARRRGVGARLVSALVDASETWWGHVRIELVVHADHAAAIALYEKHGFVVETRKRADMLRDGVHVDALGMARIRPGYVAPPELGAPPPIPPRGPRATPTLRARRKSDAAQMAALHSEPSVMEGTWQMPFQSEASWAARFEVTPPGSTIIVAEVSDRIVGSAGLFPIGSGPRTRHAAMFGISVHPAHQGTGVGDALLREILVQADGWLDLRRVELDVFVDNDRARALYERHGFVLEGRVRMSAVRRGTFIDSFAMARLKP